MEYRFPHDFNTVDICNRCCNSREEIDKRPNYERLCDVPNWEQLKKFGKKGKNNFEMESNGEEVLEDNDIESDGDVTIDEVTNTFTEKVGKENDKLITYFVFPVVFIVLFGVIAATIWNSELNLTRDSFIEKETNFVHSDFADSVTTESLRTVPNKSEFIATTVANNWKLNVFETYVDLEFRCGNTGHDFTRCMLWSNHDLEKYGANFKESSCSTRIFGCISLKEFHEAWSECKSEYSARFNVLIGVHPRKSDPNFMYLKRALQSIRSQTYPYWRVFIAGDGLESDHVQKLLTHLDSELSAFNLNWFFVNVPPVCSERNLQGIESTVVWAIGGVASINAAMVFFFKMLVVIKALPFYLNDQYSARLDDDDYFLETHLEDLAAGFALFNVDFAYTQGDGFVGEGFTLILSSNY